MRINAWLVFVSVAVLGLPGALPASAAPAEDEVRQLRRELREAQAQIEKLKRDNAELQQALARERRGPAPARPAVAPPSASQPIPTAAVAAPRPLPAWDPAVAVPLDEIIQHYRADAVAAQARYGAQRVRIRGTIDRIEAPWAGMTYTLHLRGADPIARARCETRFPGISDFRLSPDRRHLSGAKPFKREKLLVSAGAEFALEGRCAGLKDGQLLLDNCRPLE